MPFWRLPALIAVANAQSLSADDLRLRMHALLSLPLLLVAMILIAAAVSLRFSRTLKLGRLIVTGAASGIGLAMTMGLVERGHVVTAVDRNSIALAKLEKQVGGLKGSIQTVTADLAHPDSFAYVTAAAVIKCGRIDALVNNAGIGQVSVRNDRTPIRFWETTPEQWGRFVAINAAAPINMARATVDGLKRLRRPEEVARSRGKAIKDVLPFRPAETTVEQAEQPAGEESAA